MLVNVSDLFSSLPCGGGVLPAVMSLFVGGFAMLEALFI